MDLQYTDDQRAMADAVRRFLEDRRAPGQLWTELGRQGWLGLAFPEDVGGGGGSLVDLGVFYEEAGRALLPTTYFSTVHAGLLIAELGGAEHLLAGIARGELVATVAAAELEAEHDAASYETTATLDGTWRLSGCKAFVENASLADLFLVVARTQGGRTVFVVRPGDRGVHVRPHRTFGGDDQGLVEFGGVDLDEDRVLGTPDEAGPAVDLVSDTVTALHTVEMAGGAQKVLDMTIDYVIDREQFGVPLGSFQAVQHHAANMAIALEGLRWSAWHALWRVSEYGSDPHAVSVAKSWANQAYVQMTLTAHQLHGGAGYVTDHDLHLYSKRAKAISLRLGSEDHHLERIADLLLGPTKI